MSWRKVNQMSGAIAQDRAEDAARIVREAVRMFVGRGRKVPHAMEEAARALDTTPRRIRSLYSRESVAPVREREYAGLLDRFVRYLTDEADQLRIRAAELERQATLERSGSCVDGSLQSLPGGTFERRGGCSAGRRATDRLNAAEAALARAKGRGK